MSKGPLRIGLSASMLHPDPERNLFKGKRLLYLEESMAHWLMAEGAFVFLLPTEPPPTEGRTAATSIADMVSALDAVIMTGGVDVAPECYGEAPLRPEWAGDRHRDDYEIEIIKTAVANDKPLLGICRGLQIMNVAFGGSLFQDIQTQNPEALVHREAALYDGNQHRVQIEPASGLGRLYAGVRTATINSVHHQAVKDPGKDVVIEARSADDGIVEALRLRDSTRTGVYCAAVQWHPEFQDPSDGRLLGRGPILEDFLSAARKRRR